MYLLLQTVLVKKAAIILTIEATFCIKVLYQLVILLVKLTSKVECLPVRLHNKCLFIVYKC